MRAVLLSESARRTVDSLPSQRRREFETIERMLAEFLPALQRAGLVTPATFFRTQGYRYWDISFPYLILFEVVSDAETEAESLLVHVVLSAPPRGIG